MVTPVRAGSNPFRTERLDRLQFRPQGMSWNRLRTRLGELKTRAAIVGPEGSGKTTLLTDLERHLLREGLVTVRCGAWGLRPTGSCADLGTKTGEIRGLVLLVDGADYIPFSERVRLWHAARHAAGVIETRHRRGRLPILIRTTTSVRLLEDLTLELLGSAGERVSQETLGGLFRQHRGNLRRCLLGLYDQAAQSADSEGFSADI